MHKCAIKFNCLVFFPLCQISIQVKVCVHIKHLIPVSSSWQPQLTLLPLYLRPLSLHLRWTDHVMCLHALQKTQTGGWPGKWGGGEEKGKGRTEREELINHHVNNQRFMFMQTAQLSLFPAGCSHSAFGMSGGFTAALTLICPAAK